MGHIRGEHLLPKFSLFKPSCTSHIEMLSYADSDQARKSGLFISPAWVFKTDAQKKLEGIGFVNPTDWPFVARKILELVNRCDEDP